ncbi:MAG: 23S rRNA (uracil(1939)-C(5))-methyltransferase RlmD [Bacteroidales bacterium]|nr:23S rRNA (uracil(1939)-C(5))-methyltransferase RlmD [Bacteroidales bacterium]
MIPVPKGHKSLENVRVREWHSSGKAIVSDGRHNIFVTNAIPDELVHVIYAKRQKRNYIAGSVTDIVDSSVYRVTPSCPHFFQCGGCNWMHILYEQQLIFKKALIEKALEKYQIPHPPVSDIVPSPKQFFYRGKVDFAIKFSENNELFYGFHPPENAAEIFNVETCNIIQPPVIESAQNVTLAFNNLLTDKSVVKGFTIRCNKKGEQLLIINAEREFSEIHKIVASLSKNTPAIKSIFIKIPSNNEKSVVHLSGQTFLEESINQWKFRLSADAFFQPNIFLAESLFNEIVSLASPKPNEIIYDLYTGVGTIAIHLAPFAKRVIAIENSITAIEDANFNKTLNNMDNIEFKVGDVLKTFVPDFIKQYGKPDIVVLDPPRAGTLIETLKNIIAFRPQKIVYVSCNPVSLAWNLTFLKDQYTIKKIIPYDMFPQTHHVETLVLLERNDQI